MRTHKNDQVPSRGTSMPIRKIPVVFGEPGSPTQDLPQMRRSFYHSITAALRIIGMKLCRRRLSSASTCDCTSSSSLRRQEPELDFRSKAMAVAIPLPVSSSLQSPRIERQIILVTRPMTRYNDDHDGSITGLTMYLTSNVYVHSVISYSY